MVVDVFVATASMCCPSLAMHQALMDLCWHLPVLASEACPTPPLNVYACGSASEFATRLPGISSFFFSPEECKKLCDTIKTSKLQSAGLLMSFVSSRATQKNWSTDARDPSTTLDEVSRIDTPPPLQHPQPFFPRHNPLLCLCLPNRRPPINWPPSRTMMQISGLRSSSHIGSNRSCWVPLPLRSCVYR